MQLYLSNSNMKLAIELLVVVVCVANLQWGVLGAPEVEQQENPEPAINSKQLENRIFFPHLLFSQNFYIPPKYLTIQETFVYWTAPFGKTITSVHIYGQGNPVILGGGKGYRYVNIRLESPVGQPLDTLVKIYGW